MIRLRPAAERGHANHGWLDSWHSFAFADYVDDKHVHWGPLRVINEDRVQAGQGFGTHGHRDMEIISYVLSGELAHRDSMGTAATIVPGEVQRMSAGTGVRHSEFNNSATDGAHFLQIWIIPSQPGGEPGYEQKSFADEEKRGKLRLIVSPDGRDGSVRIRQEAFVYAGLFDGAEAAELAIAAGRLAYVHVVKGAVEVNGNALSAGDALLFEEEDRVRVASGAGAEILVFDLPR
jgi:redox-sensitive bicupin YhaK (pirin superfamily)